jgi:chromosome segregation ATPase
MSGLIYAGSQILNQGVELTECLGALEDANARLVEASHDLAAAQRELRECRKELRLIRRQFGGSGQSATPTGSGLASLLSRR